MNAIYSLSLEVVAALTKLSEQRGMPKSRLVEQAVWALVELAPPEQVVIPKGPHLTRNEKAILDVLTTLGCVCSEEEIRAETFHGKADTARNLHTLARLGLVCKGPPIDNVRLWFAAPPISAGVE